MRAFGAHFFFALRRTHIEGFLYKRMSVWIDAGLKFTRTAQLSTEEVSERSPETVIHDVHCDKE